MAYPTSPTNGQIYGNKQYNSTKGAWVFYVAQAATATTASSCTGNSATATTASSCTGNSATATTATNTSGGIVTGTNIRIPTAQPSVLVNGDIWVV